MIEYLLASDTTEPRIVFEAILIYLFHNCLLPPHALSVSERSYVVSHQDQEAAVYTMCWTCNVPP